MKDWFWEGSVQATIRSFLEAQGWTIRSEAETATKAHGIDLLASRDSSSLAVEVKGYPSKTYADPAKAGQVKPTNPVNQAGHWFAQALLKAMRTRSSLPGSAVAIGLPDFPRYAALLAETEPSLRRLGIGVLWASEDATVRWLLPISDSDLCPPSLLPFASYKGGGRELLGTPRAGDGSSRRGYGVPVFEQCGWRCVYCGFDMQDSYEAWLTLSVDHVVPESTGRAMSLPPSWIHDLSNKVTSCRHCNEFLNQHRVTGVTPSTLEEFFDLRDRVFETKREWVRQRHAKERAWYDDWRGKAPPNP